MSHINIALYPVVVWMVIEMFCLHSIFSDKGDKAKIQVYGKSYSIPRKQATYGDEGLMYSFSGVHLLAKPWTPALERIRDAVTKATGHTFNFVLINR